MNIGGLNKNKWSNEIRFMNDEASFMTQRVTSVYRLIARSFSAVRWARAISFALPASFSTAAHIRSTNAASPK